MIWFVFGYLLLSAKCCYQTTDRWVKSQSAWFFPPLNWKTKTQFILDKSRLRRCPYQTRTGRLLGRSFDLNHRGEVALNGSVWKLWDFCWCLTACSKLALTALTRWKFKSHFKSVSQCLIQIVLKLKLNSSNISLYFVHFSSLFSCNQKFDPHSLSLHFQK